MAASAPWPPAPVTLAGRHVRLEPLETRHAGELLEASRDPEMWKYLPRPPLHDMEDCRRWIEEARSELEARTSLPLAIIDLARERAVGSTRLFDFQIPHRGLELGWTWLGKKSRRSPVNTECKRLLLAHCFETLDALRVQLKTDRRNEVSRRAIARLGAREEGILRQHRLCWDGHVRDTVMFGVVRADWPAMKDRLDKILSHS